MIKNIFALSLIALTMLSCGSKSAEEKEKGDDDFSKNVNRKSPEEILVEIYTLDSTLVNAESLNTMLFTAEEQLTLCEVYLENFPNKAGKPEVMLKAANACRALSKPQEAINYLNRFLGSYADHKDRAEALFTKAFIFDEDLQDKDKAKKTYTQLIQQHPNSLYRENAEILMEQLYLTDAELIEKFRKQNSEN